MNQILFQQTGGFPINTQVFGAMQQSYQLLNSLGELAGNHAIISGCKPLGNRISDGVLYINGELLEFRESTLSDFVVIRQEEQTDVFEDGSTRPILYKRYAIFGSSTSENEYPWGLFRRVFPTTEIQQTINKLEERLQTLEEKKSPVPLGLVAIWGKPASEPIPEGWQEYIPLRGRFPLGWDPNDSDFRGEILSGGGEKTHRLTIDEMPRHSHSYDDIYYSEAHGTISVPNRFGSARSDNDNGGHQMRRTSLETGGNRPHNNMPPYRIIKYIEFIGF